MERVILHSDCNCFYASVEMLHHPEYAGKPLAVGGHEELRHGIILTANYIAKGQGVKTGMALWQARQVCPDLIVIPPRYDLYMRFSRLAHEIYADYTDLQEPFGIDECWLDVTASASCRGDGMSIAREISRRIKSELGITVSIGVSWNKIFAKFGSDYRKPDAITEIRRDNYRDIVWQAPAEELLYVGRATKRKLYMYGLKTVGDIAQADPRFLQMIFGKVGLVLYAFARGEDQTPVCHEDFTSVVKSVGNSTTTPRDLTTEADVEMVVYLLAESVASRLRDNGFAGRVIGISVRDNGLSHFSRQHKIAQPTNISDEITREAMRLFRANYRWHAPIRSIGIRASDLVPDDTPYQTDFFHSEDQRRKELDIDRTVDDIRRRFGYQAIRRGIMYLDPALTSLDAKTENTIHPRGYMEYGNQTGAEEYYGKSGSGL